MYKLRARHSITLLSFFLIISSRGQESWIDTSPHSGLRELRTDYSFKTLVSNNSVKSITGTLKRLNAAKQYFDEIFNTDLDFAVLFVENEKWGKHAYFPPPGLPQAIHGNVILGLDKSVLSITVEETIDRLPEQHQAMLKPVYGDDINLDLFYRDILSIHELAHLYHFKEGTNPQRKWLQELFATMSMYSFVKEKSKYAYDLMNTYPEFVLNSGDRMPEHKTLKDFEEKYVQNLSPQNYEWFQMQFYQHARSIIDSGDRHILERLHNFLINTDLDRKARLTDEELSLQLKKEVSTSVSDISDTWKYK